MKTFYNILHKLYTVTPELKNEFFKDVAHTIDFNIQLNEMKYNNDTMNIILISSFISSNYNTGTISTKFDYIKKQIDNPFLSTLQKDNFLTVFCKAQLLYKRICRLVHIWKWRRKKPIITTDLLLNPINESNYFTIAIVHLNSKYLFTKSDLTNIIEKALTNSPDIFAEPVSIKNPYNNLTFNKHHLYNIYFFMKYGGFVIPTIFHQYFLYNFHLKYFRDNNESLIRKMHISSMVNINDNDKLVFDIHSMLTYHNDRVITDYDKININDKFPDQILINAMKPYLHMFYVMNYSLDIAEKGTATHELYYLLHKFKKQNPAFGRKITRIASRFGQRSRHTEFCTNYIPYNKIQYNKNYDTCHMVIYENNIDDETHNSDTAGFIPIYMGRTTQFINDSELDDNECDDSDDSDDDNHNNDHHEWDDSDGSDDNNNDSDDNYINNDNDNDSDSDNDNDSDI